MSAIKAGSAFLIAFVVLGGSVQAQTGGRTYGIGGVAGYPGGGTNNSYYAINGGFGNYGLPGSYPNYQGYGFSGYGPGSAVGGYFPSVPNTPKTYNNTGGLMNTIRQQTGKPGSYRSTPNNGVPRGRRVR